MPVSLNEDERLRYSRSILLPEVGEGGQRSLKAASVLVVGMGGLGSASATYLAAAGVGRIGIVDSDTVDLSNLQRQILHGTTSVGRPKTESARRRMLDLNPGIRVEVFNDVFSSANADTISSPYEIIVDGTDNLETRYLINDLCIRCGKIYVYGALYRYEGQAAVFDARTGPCYRCLFPEPQSGLERNHPDERAVFSMVPGIVGSIQAAETVKVILGIGSSLSGRLLLIDTLGMHFQEVLLSKNPDCTGCGGRYST